jgi:uracil-DNA glycosylase
VTPFPARGVACRVSQRGTLWGVKHAPIPCRKGIRLTFRSREVWAECGPRPLCLGGRAPAASAAGARPPLLGGRSKRLTHLGVTPRRPMGCRT